MVQTESKNKKVHKGTVVSDKMNKTVVVEVERTAVHPFLSKVVRTKKKYKVHDESEQANVGDQVIIYEGRPKSKTKYMYLERVVVPATVK
jgi:small subunit ribosomal protein S17